MAEAPDAAPLPSYPAASERFRLALDCSLDAVTKLQQPASALVGRNLIDILPGNRKSGLGLASVAAIVERHGG